MDFHIGNRFDNINCKKVKKYGLVLIPYFIISKNRIIFDSLFTLLLTFMKRFFFLLLISITTCNLYSQVEPYDYPSKKQRKVEVVDTLDELLNDLIDFNESLLKRGNAFSMHEQWNFGEIYNLDGDTLQGEININTYQGGQASMIILFRENSESKKKRYRADKLKGFSINETHYVSRKFSGLPPSYIEILEKGSVNLYFTKYRQYSERYNPATQTSYPGLYHVYEFYVEPLSGDSRELLGPVPVSYKKFPDVIIPYLNDYPQLTTKIKDGKYDFTHLREIIQVYNMYRRK